MAHKKEDRNGHQQKMSEREILVSRGKKSINGEEKCARRKARRADRSRVNQIWANFDELKGSVEKA